MNGRKKGSKDEDSDIMKELNGRRGQGSNRLRVTVRVREYFRDSNAILPSF